MLTATYGIPPRHGAVLSDTLRALGCITVELHVGTGCVYSAVYLRAFPWH